MKLLGYDLRPKDVKDVSKKMEDYLVGKLKTKSEVFSLSQFETIKEKLEDLASDDDPVHFGLKERARTLLDALPENPIKNLFQKDKNKEPSDFEKMKFLRLVSLISDPELIFTFLEDNTLSYQDVDNLSINFPDFHERLVLAAIDTTTDYLSKNDYFDLKRDQMLCLAKIIGIDILTPSKLSALKQKGTDEPLPPKAGPQLNPPLGQHATTLNQAVNPTS